MSSFKRGIHLTSFKGGIHPEGHKNLTLHKGGEPFLPTEVIIPLQQHIGNPCDSTVAKGDYVKVGEKIGESKGFVSVPIHASVSGEVVAIKEHPHPVLGRALSVVIRSDEKDNWIEPSYIHKWEEIRCEDIKNIIRDAGIVGLGGAAFPTHIKLSPPENKPIQTVILNGAECEPYLTCDHKIMVERTDDVIEGLQIIMKTLNVNEAYIGIEANKSDAIQLFKSSIKKKGIKINVVILKVKYPQGAEKQLIKAILKREVPSGGLPMDVGVIVQNVSTALAISEALTHNKPLIERQITVSGNYCIKEPQNLLVRIGTLFSDIIEFCGGFSEEPAKVIMGGPMMGISQERLDVPVIKGTSGILALSKKEVQINEIKSCIRCGACVEGCPMGLMPQMISIAVQRARLDIIKQYSVKDCIECGCCAYLCPAKRPLVQYIKLAKLMV